MLNEKFLLGSGIPVKQQYVVTLQFPIAANTYQGMTSIDGTNWSSWSKYSATPFTGTQGTDVINNTYATSGVAYGTATSGVEYWVVTIAGGYLWSIDGTTWNVQALPNTSAWYREVVFGNGRWVITGIPATGGGISYSFTDPTTGSFTAGAWPGANATYTQSITGTTTNAYWSPNASLNLYTCLFYLNNTFIVTGQPSYGFNGTSTVQFFNTPVFTSTDGINWTDRTCRINFWALYSSPTYENCFSSCTWSATEGKFIFGMTFSNTPTITLDPATWTWAGTYTGAYNTSIADIVYNSNTSSPAYNWAVYSTLTSCAGPYSLGPSCFEYSFIRINTDNFSKASGSYTGLTTNNLANVYTYLPSVSGNWPTAFQCRGFEKMVYDPIKDRYIALFNGSSYRSNTTITTSQYASCNIYSGNGAAAYMTGGPYPTAKAAYLTFNISTSTPTGYNGAKFNHVACKTTIS